jgi:hypothetical protein
MRWVLVGYMAIVSGCGAVVEDAEPCELDERLVDKRWLVGDLASSDDDPLFRATVSVVSVELDGPHQPGFIGATAELDVRFEIDNTHLVARAIDDAQVDPLAVFPILNHRDSACYFPYDPSGMYQPPQQLPWYERPWFRGEWGMNLSEKGYRFDAAAAAGHPDAARLTPVGNYDPAREPHLVDGVLVTFTKIWVEWRPIDDQTPGCSFDLPSLEPGAACPVMLVELRHEFRRD